MLESDYLRLEYHIRSTLLINSTPKNSRFKVGEEEEMMIKNPPFDFWQK